jgi:dipeptidyl aminopeptidase/acylaminoacyl peptidase
MRSSTRPRALALVAAAALLTCAGLAAAQTAAPPAATAFTAHHVAKVRSVSSASVSRDGTMVAYTLLVPRVPLVDDDGGPWEELHVVGRDKVSRPFITGEVNVGGVRWSADGRAITFLARRGKDTARSLYRIPVDGGEARRILAHETDIAAYTFSPDGARVAFTARESASKARKDLEKKGFNQELFEEDVPFVRVFVAALNEGAAPPRQLPLDGSASTLLWSPAGNRLAVALAPTPLVDDDLMMRRVHVVDADSGAVVTKLDNPGKLGQVAWSPDGAHVAMVSGADINDPAAGRLLVASASGGALRDVLPGYLGHVSAIAFRDSSTIAYIGDEGVETVFAEVKLDGTGRRTLLPAGGRILSSFEFSKDGATTAFLADTPLHPSEVFVMAAGDTAPQRLTDSNPWFATMRFAKQEVVKFKARDGLELEGLLVRPLDEQPGRRYPLILTVHGGPEAHDRNGWRTGYSNAGQFGAAKGYAVFYPNYRGSTGRGVAFSKLGQGDPAGKEFDDLVDAVDHLVKTGLVDGKKVGITGGSYGGYASAWGATYYSDRFAAAVMFVGISNNVSRVGTTDIPNEEYLVHALKRAWEDWEGKLKTSPLYYTDRAKTPILILHGTADPRVNPTQSLELYRHLKLRDQAPVRFVRYPGEPHGNRRAAARLDYSLRMMQWFDHYLQGPGGAPPAGDLEYGDAR